MKLSISILNYSFTIALFDWTLFVPNVITAIEISMVRECKVENRIDHRSYRLLKYQIVKRKDKVFTHGLILFNRNLS